ncbi:MAG TPA: nicotinamide-nucleotide adenylyltransferase [Geobacterales bacterium]|nr:nicotinamide-nucleotide adenylyltransferase [Geobacterales bacterium]
MDPDRALYIGRFQPFHNGHYQALRWILSQFEQVVLAIGSAQYSHTKENPLTVGERIECIWSQLRLDGLLDRVIVVAVPDVGLHSQWVSVVKQYCPNFKVVFSNDNLTRLLFKEAGYEIRNIPFFDREIYEATKIREAISKGQEWEKLVPMKVAEYIKSKRIDERIRSIFNS